MSARSVRWFGKPIVQGGQGCVKKYPGKDSRAGVVKTSRNRNPWDDICVDSPFLF